jgi:translation initiation factor 1
MSKKSNSDKHGYVYSTDPNFKFEEQQEVQETLEPAMQMLRVRLDTKRRGGKTVTLIEGFIGTSDALEALGKLLKNHCGTGGSAKDSEIIVQGDQREKTLQWLLKNGYVKSKKV